MAAFRYDPYTEDFIQGRPTPAGSRPGRNIFAAAPLGAFLANRQIDQTIKPMVAARGSFQFLPPAQVSQPLQPSSTNPFATLSNVKNPDIASAVADVLNRVRGLSGDPSQNENVVKRNERSPTVAAEVSGGFQRLRDEINDSSKSVADFAKAFLETQPEARALYDQEAGAIGEFYGGADDPNSVIANLNRLSAGRNRAISTSAERSIGNAIARNNIARLIGGDSSYLDQQLMDAVGSISADAAREKADQDLRNYLAVKDTQARLSGQRNRLLDAVTGRGSIPIDLAQRVRAGDLSRLATLSGLDLSNTIAEVDSPERTLARQLELLGGVQRLDALNTFYGLQKPYEPNESGLLIGPPIRRAGGFNYGFDLPPDAFSQEFVPEFSPRRGLPAPSLPSSRNNPIAQEYFQITGVWPDEDPYRSDYLIQQLNAKYGIDPRATAQAVNPANMIDSIDTSGFRYLA